VVLVLACITGNTITDNAEAPEGRSREGGLRLGEINISVSAYPKDRLVPLWGQRT
jgi:hypothetical protein